MCMGFLASRLRLVVCNLDGWLYIEANFSINIFWFPSTCFVNCFFLVSLVARIEESVSDY